MDNILNRFFKMPWLRKPVSVILILIGSYFLFDFLKDASWTFFLFLNQETFAKYILNYSGPFKLLQQLKNDRMIYFSFAEALTYILPFAVIIAVLIWIHHRILKATNHIIIRVRDFLNKEYKYLIWVNVFILSVFLIDFVNFSKFQYIKSVNEFLQFKIWMVEHDRKVDTGCVYYPKREGTFYYKIDSIDFFSHFTGYSLSPLSESLKDVLSVTPETPVAFDLSLCDSNTIDLNKTYTGRDVVQLMNEYADSCGKKDIIKELKIKNINAPIRVEKEGNKIVVSMNYKPFAIAEFMCSKDSRELTMFRSMKILNGD